METNLSDFVRRFLRSSRRHCEMVIALLAKPSLPDAERRTLIRTLRLLFQCHRRALFIAEWHGAIPAAELSELRREFAQVGLAVCEQQIKALDAKLNSPKLPVRQYCARANTYCTLLQMSRQFQRELDALDEQALATPAPSRGGKAETRTPKVCQ